MYQECNMIVSLMVYLERGSRAESTCSSLASQTSEQELSAHPCLDYHPILRIHTYWHLCLVWSQLECFACWSVPITFFGHRHQLRSPISQSFSSPQVCSFICIRQDSLQRCSISLVTYKLVYCKLEMFDCTDHRSSEWVKSTCEQDGIRPQKDTLLDW